MTESSWPAIDGIDDFNEVRVALFINGRAVHVPLAKLITKELIQSQIYGHWMQAETGKFTLTGHDALLTRDQAELIAEVGSFAMTGNDAGLFKIGFMDAEAGSFVLTGNDVGFSIHAGTLQAETGAFDLTGMDVDFRRDLVLNAEAGAFDLTGMDVDLHHLSFEPFVEDHFNAGTQTIPIPEGASQVVIECIGRGGDGDIAGGGGAGYSRTTISDLTGYTGLYLSVPAAQQTCFVRQNTSGGTVLCLANSGANGGSGGGGGASGTGDLTRTGGDGAGVPQGRHGGGAGGPNANGQAGDAGRAGGGAPAGDGGEGTGSGAAENGGNYGGGGGGAPFNGTSGTGGLPLIRLSWT